MNTQPEALRLAEQLETEWGDDCELEAAAAELRRLHEENERNKTTIKEWLQANAPGGWIDELRALNQELLESLHECLGAVEGLEAKAKIWSGIANKARAAIAKAEANYG